MAEHYSVGSCDLQVDIHFDVLQVGSVMWDTSAIPQS